MRGRRSLGVLAAGLLVTIGVLAAAPVASSEPSCPDLSRLVNRGQLLAAQTLAEELELPCVDDVLERIDEKRGEAAAQLSAAEREFANASEDDELTAAEVADLVQLYAVVVAIDASNQAAVDRLDGLLNPPDGSTTTTSTTLALDLQIERLADLDLTEAAQTKVAEYLATGGTIPPDLAARIDGASSYGDRLSDAWDTVLEWLIPLMLVAAIALLVLGAALFVRSDRRAQRWDDGARLAIVAAGGDEGSSFSAAVRARMTTGLREYDGLRAAVVESAVPALPKFGDLDDHLKPFDWFLTHVWHRDWSTLTPTLHGSDDRGASVTLEVSRVATTQRSSLRTLPDGEKPPDEKSAAARLVGPTVAWTLTHWKGEEDPERLTGTGTKNWQAFSANLQGLDHLAAGRFDAAAAAFATATDLDPDYFVARNNQYLSLIRKYADSEAGLRSILVGLESLKQEVF